MPVHRLFRTIARIFSFLLLEAGRRHRFSFLALLLMALLGGSLLTLSGEETETLPRIYKVICLRSREGCACRSPRKGAKPVRLYHAVAVRQASRSEGARKGETAVLAEGERCFYPAKSLLPMEFSSVLHSPLQEKNHAPLPLHRFVEGISSSDTAVRQLSDMKRVDLGLFWPTYYHLALEDFHPGAKTKILSRTGKVLGLASRKFLEQVMWEGSGITSTGARLHYTGQSMRFETYDLPWGYGAGYGYQVFPYRTLAVNFPGICKKLKDLFPRCSKRNVIGLMVFIPEIASRAIPVEGGTSHDGYFCLTDTGSPYYIRSDRIDIFVGVHGGGNPYLPLERQKNLLLQGGVKNLVPSDWRIWTSPQNRVWCPEEKIPVHPLHPRPKECTHDYHVVAADKALTLQALFRKDGTPLRCKKNPSDPAGM